MSRKARNLCYTSKSEDIIANKIRDMDKNYTDYTTEKLLEDDFFIQSIQHSTSETEQFWKKQIESGFLNKLEYRLAVHFLRIVKVKVKELPADRQSQLWEEIEITNKKYLKTKIKKYWILMVSAACVTIFVALGIPFFLSNQATDISVIANTIRPDYGGNAIQLVLPDNRKIPINEENSVIQHNSEGVITVNSKKVAIEKVKESTQVEKDLSKEFNQLIVPYGKRSTLNLPDGSKLWVNAGSRIVYPIQFASDKREIYVDGEAYLEVAHDANRPFIVKTSQMDVKVLGTSFNVMAYKNDKSSSVVLVTGSVQISTNDKEKAHLEPNKMFLYSDGIAQVKEVDVSDYTLWKEGLYAYESENLAVILDRLIRYYGKKIHYTQDIASLKCSGKLNMQDNLEIVLDGLMLTAPVTYSKLGEEYILQRLPKDQKRE